MPGPNRIFYAFLLFLPFGLWFSAPASAQTGQEVAMVHNTFEGKWYCKAANRYLEIFADAADSNRVIIYDWSVIANRKVAMNTDVYSAFLRGQKLITPADNKEHRAPYCELLIKDGQLIYTCNGGLNVTDQFLNGDQYSSTLTFTRKTDNKK